jgi:dipeptidyl aminopeptidase/acylaminoacyl peptidase
MRKIVLLIEIIIFTILPMYGQKKLGIEDVISGGKNYSRFVPEQQYYSFLGNTDSLLHNTGDSLFVIDKDKNRKLILSLKEYNNKLKSNDLKVASSLYNIKWGGNNEFYIINEDAVVVYGIRERKIAYAINYPSKATGLSFNIEAKSLVYLFNKNLYLAKPNVKPILVEKTASKDVKLGQVVHRYEFGIDKGVFWSPKGNSFAFYYKDESMVKDYPLVNVKARVAELQTIKYPMAGMASHEVKVGIYHINSDQLIYLKTGLPKDRFFTNISWDKDEKYLFVAELNRGQNCMRLNVYDTKRGQFVKTLFEEKSDKWVEPENPLLNVPGQERKFVWISERDGYNHLYLYDLNKGLQSRLTEGDWEVTKVHGFGKGGKEILFESTKDGVLQRHLYAVNIRTKEIDKISKEKGYHVFTVSYSGETVIDEYSNLSKPRVIQLINRKGDLSKQLYIASNPFAKYSIGKIKLDTIVAADGKTDLYCRMILPPDFDTNKKYPVIVYVYGGPHVQLVKDSWLAGARLWQLYMAQEGYVVFSMDNRGTPYRGCGFEKVIHRQLGEVEALDQYQGIKYLTNLPYVDTARIGIHGWSYGGFMTINMMQKYSEFLKVGVSGGPVTDWKYYEVMYGERYMDTPEENPEGYLLTNLNNKVDKLKGRLLVIHGAMDPVVVWQHSLFFAERCIKQGVQFDYFVYPSHEHNVLGKDRVHLMKKVSQYFFDFL